MSEHLKPSELDLTWIIGTSTVKIAGIDILCTTENTAYWTYRKTPLLNHLTFSYEGRNKRVFIDPSTQEDLFERLEGAGITHIAADYPSNELLEQWWEIEMDDFDEEMSLYEESGEYPYYGS